MCYFPSIKAKLLDVGENYLRNITSVLIESFFTCVGSYLDKTPLYGKTHSKCGFFLFYVKYLEHRIIMYYLANENVTVY